MPPHQSEMGRYREIPIQHEHVRQNPTHHTPTAAPQSGFREIPIQHEQPQSFGWKENVVDPNSRPFPAQHNPARKTTSQHSPGVRAAGASTVPPASQPPHHPPPSAHAPQAPPQHQPAPQPPNVQNLKEPEQPQRAASPCNPNLTQLEQVQKILKEAIEMQAEVNAFTGGKQDKQYKYLEEMLTRKMLKLDNIESAGNEEIRSVRRQAVKTVDAMIDQLELKAFANEQKPPESAAGANSDNEQTAATDSAQETDMSVDAQSQPQQTHSDGERNTVNDFMLESEMKC